MRTLARYFGLTTILAILPLTGATQSAVRPSLAGEYSAALSTPAIDRSGYNLQLGPVLVGLSGSINAVYNDNVNLAEHDRQSDLILEPQINANLFWQVSAANSLKLDLGLGYSKYINHPQYDTSSITITPNSDLAFDLYIGDFRFRFFDQFSIQQNPVTEINLSNVAKLDRIENSAGLSVTWDANSLILTGAYSHYNFYSFDSDFDYLDQSEDQFLLSGGLKLSDALRIGVRGTFALVSYRTDFQNDSLQYSVGPFLEAQLTEYTKASIEGGYQGGNFDQNGGNEDNSQLNSYYFNVKFDHRLNRYWTDSLTVGHETDLGYTTNYTELTYVRYEAAWRINSRLTANLNAFYEHGQDSEGFFDRENIDRYGAGISFSYALGYRINLNCSYVFIDRKSDQPGQSYYQNSLLFGVNYVF